MLSLGNRISLANLGKQNPRDVYYAHLRCKLPCKSEIEGLAWGLAHWWGPQLTVLVLGREGHALAGSHSVGLSAGSRRLQTAACGGVVQTGKSL